ncbi:MAG: metallophosphoesterase [Oscillospiraceae bacterium]|nr:metallophosphoesterase [Oscillospiraceae bacterium]
MPRVTKFFDSNDDNIAALRAAHPEGLRFVVGDTHGECPTLRALMEKIRFDPARDHVFFVGDYNAGGDPTALLRYISLFYQADCRIPGFHLIRGNHERELGPIYPLENLPDLFVVRGAHLDFFIAHAGMVSSAFDLICRDMAQDPGKSVYSYGLDDCCVAYDAPLRQLIWSRRGLYSQRSRWHTWPSEDALRRNRACIIHGHTPFCFFMGRGPFSYGDLSLFWNDQHIWYSQDLRSFDIDANVKGRYENGESYRGLACLCLDSLDEIAGQNGGDLTIGSILQAPNFVFAADHAPGWDNSEGGIRRVLDAAPKMKRIGLDRSGEPFIRRAD